MVILEILQSWVFSTAVSCFETSARVVRNESPSWAVDKNSGVLSLYRVPCLPQTAFLKHSFISAAAFAVTCGRVLSRESVCSRGQTARRTRPS